MLTSTDPQIAQAMRKAAVRAMRAPSVHNTQPWSFTIKPGGLEVRADWSRQLGVLDPTGRQLMISCGCALFNARVSVERSGYQVSVDHLPDPTDRALLARLTVTGQRAQPSQIGHLDSVIDVRQTNRRRFAPEPVDQALVDSLIEAAAHEGALLVQIRHLEQSYAVARLTQSADRDQNADPRYRAELRAWTSDDARRNDGVPATAVPHVTGEAYNDIPIRDFDTRGYGGLPVDSESSVHQCLLVLATAADTPDAWMEAGQALERVWLEAARQGHTMSLFTQPVEVPWIREALRNELQMSEQPHMVIRLGRAAPTPFTRRRRLVEVINESSDSADLPAMRLHNGP